MHVRFQDLTIGYRTGRNVKVIAERLTGELTGGELTCLVGRNGTGKSTFLRTIAGLQVPIGGRVEVTPPRPSQGEGVGENSISIHSLSANERAKMIGVVLTQKPDVQNMTVEEVVGLGRTPYTGFFGSLSKADRAIVAEAMEQVGIMPLAQRNIQMLSDGERQKVMIAKALAQQTPVILLDEPTAFLDYPSKVEMMQMLRQMAKEMDKTIVLSTHDIELAAKIATRFLLLSEKGLQEVQASELLTSFSS
ncbi:MAG: ABC transporter ATP-binding protein [Prevotella sp.]|nr:ABC transporter ATP-binding protein [Prevotella sp.]